MILQTFEDPISACFFIAGFKFIPDFAPEMTLVSQLAEFGLQYADVGFVKGAVVCLALLVASLCTSFLSGLVFLGSRRGER